VKSHEFLVREGLLCGTLTTGWALMIDWSFRLRRIQHIPELAETAFVIK